MDQLSFTFTIFFTMLGPAKLIPAFAGVTQGSDAAFKRAVAVRAAIIASALCAFVALAGGTILLRYQISINALRLAGALVLMLSALGAIFRHDAPAAAGAGAAAPLQLAVAPVAAPMIVPPAGIAVILLFIMSEPAFPGIAQAVAICLAIMMVLDLLVMYFIDAILRTPGLKIILTVLASVLLFVQVCIAMEMFVRAFTQLGLVKG